MESMCFFFGGSVLCPAGWTPATVSCNVMARFESDEAFIYVVAGENKPGHLGKIWCRWFSRPLEIAGMAYLH